MERKPNDLLDYTKTRITSLEFKYTHKTAPEHFTRTSKLNFENTALMILKMIKKSIKVELMDFFYQVDKETETPSRQAFSQAREKISYLAFKDLFDYSCGLTLKSKESETYKGYSIFAVDGTSFTVGDIGKLSGYFGNSTTIEGKAMCRISGIIDVLEECIVDAAVSPFETGERALAIRQIEKIKFTKKAIYLFDRGYWSPELVEKVAGNGQKFLMRINKENLAAAKNKMLRCYTFTLPSGNEEILVTNLSADEVFDEELAFLYTKRWGAETKYLELKARLQIDKFSGESANIILQDIYSTLYISNLVAFTCSEADKVIKRKTEKKDNKYKQKANRSTCISAYRKRFIDICFITVPCLRDAALDKLYNDISRDVSYINKSKPKPRNKHQINNSRRHFSKPVL